MIDIEAMRRKACESNTGAAMGALCNEVEILRSWLKGDHLSFARLRAANVARLPLFPNYDGQPGNHHDDWSANDWATATAGELGELCNLLKKRRRGEPIPDEEIADELADVICYLDLLANNLGIDIEEAVCRKFNAVSERVELQTGRPCPVRL